MRQPLPVAFFLTDDERVPDPLGTVAALPPGVGVIVRDYGRADRRDVAADAVALCGQAGRLVLVAGDAGLAAEVGADGVHWPSHLLRNPTPLRRPGVSVSTAAVHDRRELAWAVRAGVDAVIVSPVFATPSHPGVRPLGVNAFARLVRLAPIPVYAMGGVGLADAGRLAKAGASGIAGIGLFL